MNWVETWCEENGLGLQEASDIARIRVEVIRDNHWSPVCERWLRAITASVDLALNETQLSTFLERYSTRQDAILALYTVAWRALIRETGPAKIREYLTALQLTEETSFVGGEIREHASSANN